MLRSLYIKNFALIDDITVEFGPGLNILTGETGAGKSILLDALQVALGGRASAEYIRAGEDKATVQAAFEIPTMELTERLTELGIDASDGVLILAREISRNGRNWCRVNGQVVTLTMYRQAGGGLVDLHVQNQQQSLLNTERHLELLDSYGKEQLVSQQKLVATQYQAWHKFHSKLEQMQRDAREMARQLDMLQFQAQEIEKAHLTPDEDHQLQQERDLLANAEKIVSLANLINRNLYRGGGKYQVAAVELVGEALDALKELHNYDQRVAPWQQALESALYGIEDVAREIFSYMDNIEFDPQRLDYIEKRINDINHLKRKYGESVAEILSYYHKITSQLDDISHSEEQFNTLQQQAEECYQQYLQQGQVLSELRQQVAVQLEQDVAKELAHLEMARVEFKVEFTPLDKPASTGLDAVQYLIAPNPGEPLKPLHKIASGGELSRFMLAAKSLLAEVDEVHTLVFDEVDTGVGGRALHAVGEKMAQIGATRQVITVTHAPQVASFAKNHYLIKKEVMENRTFTRIIKLDYNARLEELSRMLGGQSAVAISHAKELLKNSQTS